MSSIEQTARSFFEACETGQGWAACAGYCTPDASFAAQSGALAGVETLEAYAEWMKGLLTILQDGSYEITGFAADEGRSCVIGTAIFRGTHTGDGGPVPPTGKATASDYVYRMDFDASGKIRHMTKVWNDGWALAELGWA